MPRLYPKQQQSYSPTPPIAPYRGQRTHGTFNTRSNNGFGDSSRSVNKTFYRTGSDPHTKEQSQGHRPKGCGPAKPNHKPSPLDYAFYIRNQARDAGENVVDNVQDFAEDPQGTLDEWEKDIKSRLKTNWAKGMADINSGRIFSVKHWKKELAPIATAASIGIGMLPVVGSLYDAYSVWLGRDPLTGAPISKAEMGLIVAGIVGGFVGLGFIDEAGDIGKGLVKGVGSADKIADAAKSARYVDDVAGAAKGLGRADEVIAAAKNLDNIDEALLAAKNLDNIDEALAVTRNLDELEDAALLSRADELAYTPRLSNNLDDAPVSRSQRTDAPEGSNFGGVCERNSFTAGTVVQTDDGEKAIEEVAVGDKVFAEASGRTARSGNQHVLKFGLFKVTICGQNMLQFTLLHHHKRDAVG